MHACIPWFDPPSSSSVTPTFLVSVSSDQLDSVIQREHLSRVCLVYTYRQDLVTLYPQSLHLSVCGAQTILYGSACVAPYACGLGSSGYSPVVITVTENVGKPQRLSTGED
ncbi:hypothetical protein BABINDRAFT_169241 [Babjeviella inositovora NRRL Y-12698]|uniref:Uncharacterized protein n=1 Tax=Babjeviella inositovora NRRL Y-12698 TaxID=984486 RepID=A0A1E3QJW3_9ASCO|nr:uncharacterized protein BABINDRAFT_169241 [Babjeviella inositovora NRRL Y-12698]ODQ77372.1 hypothetical protein BABINDRAFT_169241 [Babjeviella inositovora NRRL Y-12698]